MSLKPRHPYLVPSITAGVVGVAILGALIVAVVDDGDAQAGGHLAPEVVARIDDLRTEREWASEVCGALAEWRGEIETATAAVRDGFDITDPGSSWAMAKAAFDDVRAATATMVKTVRAAEVPDTEAGRALAGGLDTLIEHGEGHVEAIGVRLAIIGGDVGVTDGFSLPGLVDDVRALIDDARADIDALRGPASEMLTVLRANDDCGPFLTMIGID